jgi:hypothetical protein
MAFTISVIGVALADLEPGLKRASDEVLGPDCPKPTRALVEAVALDIVDGAWVLSTQHPDATWYGIIVVDDGGSVYSRLTWRESDGTSGTETWDEPLGSDDEAEVGESSFEPVSGDPADLDQLEGKGGKGVAD